MFHQESSCDTPRLTNLTWIRLDHIWSTLDPCWNQATHPNLSPHQHWTYWTTTFPGHSPCLCRKAFIVSKGLSVLLTQHGRGHRGSKSKVISARQAKSATVTLDPSVTEAVWNMDRNGMKLWLVRINSKRGSNLWSSYLFSPPARWGLLDFIRVVLLLLG